MLLGGWLLTLRLRRLRWLHTLERWAPDRCTVGTAATIAGTNPETLARVLEGSLDRPVTASTMLTKAEILAALRAQS